MKVKDLIEKLKNPKKIDLISILRQFKREGIENFVITRSDVVETVLKELEKKDKIIDLMAKKFSETVCFAPLNQKCNQGDKNFDKSKCIECIKQYFEKKAEKESSKRP